MPGQPKFDWFQSESEVALNILKKGVPLEECIVTYSDRRLTVQQNDEVLFTDVLFSEVDKDHFVVKCTPSKIELKMPKKVRGERWTSLLASTECAPTGAMMAPGPITETPTFFKKNWDAIEKAAIQEEEQEKTVGDEATNHWFKTLYQNASDDVKKAMIKSYQESGGTVLSTNWEDIKSRKVEVQPPDCMEYKKYAS
ncbi:unnamed protein product [Caenorhabditis bovis]|uniref:SGS domain-containing protein n=1 Tax=Caenorhabditis bovis TaxID=2654633 RepID=A0A8S1E855_9PELO|nr:unnamed protein product [Caenorhabditis bovis]